MKVWNRLESFQISIPATVRFGPGSVSALGNELDKLRVTRALIIVDPGVYRTGVIQQIKELLPKTLEKVEVFSDVEPEPSLAGLNRRVKELKNDKYDIIIAVGGGSSIDTAKGLSVLLTHGGDGQTYIGTDKIPGKGIPLIAIPTTAGTGSEVTNIAIFSDTEKELKVGMISNYILARAALVDPTLTYSCPPSVSAASGIDALVHAIECYTSLKATSFTDGLAEQAMRLISNNLRNAVLEESNRGAKNSMAEGALLAGIAFGNSGVAAVHAMSYPLGSRFHVSHGVANGLLLPYVMEYNLSANFEKYADIARLLGEPVKGLAVDEAAAASIKFVRNLVKLIGIPTRLRDLKVPQGDLEDMAKATMDVTRLLANNPRKLTLDDVRQIWQKAW